MLKDSFFWKKMRLWPYNDFTFPLIEVGEFPDDERLSLKKENQVSFDDLPKKALNRIMM